MPVQNKISVEKRVFCAGLLSFSIGTALLLRTYNGYFLELIPAFLIFFAAVGFSSFSGRISEKKSIHFLYLLIFSGLLLYFKESFLAALIGGIVVGTFSADAFAVVTEKQNWHFSLRDYLAGGIFGIVIAGNGFYSPTYAVPFALFFYALSVFCWKVESKRSGWIYGVLFLFFVSGAFAFTEFYKQRTPLEIAEKNIPVKTNKRFLRRVNVLSLVHFPLRNVLQILPDGSRENYTGEIVNVNQSTLFYGGRIGIHDQFHFLSKSAGAYDLIIVELPDNEFSMYSWQFINSLKRKLMPHGVLICFLPNDDLLRAGGLRASLQKNFRFLKASQGVASIAASDQPLIIDEKFPVANILDPILYSTEWEQKTADAATQIAPPSDTDHSFERSILKQNGKDPVYVKFYHLLPLSMTVFLSVVAGVCLLYVAARYLLAYIEGMGFRLTVFRDSSLLFFTAGFIFFSKTLCCFPEGLMLCVALQFLLLGCIFGCYLPSKYAYIGLPFLLLIFILSRFLMPHIGFLFTLGSCTRSFLAGLVFPLLLRGTAEKYKTGTVEPSDLYSSVCSGLFAAALLLAIMP